MLELLAEIASKGSVMITQEQIETKSREMCTALGEDPDAPPRPGLVVINGKQINLTGWRKYEEFARHYVAANAG